MHAGDVLWMGMKYSNTSFYLTDCARRGDPLVALGVFVTQPVFTAKRICSGMTRNDLRSLKEGDQRVAPTINS